MMIDAGANQKPKLFITASLVKEVRIKGKHPPVESHYHQDSPALEKPILQCYEKKDRRKEVEKEGSLRRHRNQWLLHWRRLECLFVIRN